MTMHHGMCWGLCAGFTGNPDKDFVRQMIPHHQGAVDMARIQHCNSQSTALYEFNDWIDSHQRFEIETMLTWAETNDAIAHDGMKEWND